MFFALSASEGLTTLRLSRSVLAAIFEGSITFWDDSQIKELNPRASLPHEQIVIVSRADVSIENAILTEALAASSNSLAKHIGRSAHKPRWCEGKHTLTFESEDMGVVCETEEGQQMRLLYASDSAGVERLVRRTSFSLGYSSSPHLKATTADLVGGAFSVDTHLVMTSKIADCAAHQRLGACLYASPDRTEEGLAQWKASCVPSPSALDMEIEEEGIADQEVRSSRFLALQSCTVLDLEAMASSSCDEGQSKSVNVHYRSDANCTTTASIDALLGTHYVPCDTVSASSTLGVLTLVFWLLFLVACARVFTLGMVRGQGSKLYGSAQILALLAFSVGTVPLQLNFDDSSDSLSEMTCMSRPVFLLLFSQAFLYLHLHEGVYGSKQVGWKDQLVLPFGVLSVALAAAWVGAGDASKESFIDYVSLGDQGALPLTRDRCSLSTRILGDFVFALDVLSVAFCSILAFIRTEVHYGLFFSFFPRFALLLVLFYTYSLDVFSTEADEFGFVSMLSLCTSFMTLSVPMARFHLTWMDVLFLSNWSFVKRQDEMFLAKLAQGDIKSLGGNHQEWFESPLMINHDNDRFLVDGGEEKSIELSRDFTNDGEDDPRLPPIQNPGEGGSMSRSEDEPFDVVDAEVTATNLASFNVMTFQEVPDRVLEVIARACKFLRVREGELLFHAGSEEKGMYLLVEGTLQLEQASSSTSRESQFGEMRMSAPLYLGELALVSDATHSSNCRAVEGTASIIHLPKNAFRTIMYFMAPQQLAKVELKLLKKGITLRTLLSQPNLFTEFENIQKNAYAAENIQFAKYATEFHRKYFDLDIRIKKVLEDLYPEDTLADVSNVGLRLKLGSHERWLNDFLKERWTGEDDTVAGRGPTFGELISALMAQFHLSRQDAELSVICWCKRRDAEKIYETFIEEGSLNEVNLDGLSKEQIRVSLEREEFPTTLFLPAKNQIYLVLMDPFMKFKRTRSFYNVCKEVLGGGLRSPRKLIHMRSGVQDSKDDEDNLPFDERSALLFFQTISDTSKPLWASPYGLKSSLVERRVRASSFLHRIRNSAHGLDSTPEEGEEEEERDVESGLSQGGGEIALRERGMNEGGEEKKYML